MVQMSKIHNISFAGSFAKTSTLSDTFMSYRLRFFSSMDHLANGILLIWSDWRHIRLQDRLHKSKLGPSTCLQVQVVSFASYKEQIIEKQSINTTFFAGFFAKISN